MNRFTMWLKNQHESMICFVMQLLGYSQVQSLRVGDWFKYRDSDLICVAGVWHSPKRARLKFAYGYGFGYVSLPHKKWVKKVRMPLS